jgi:hypothetical protein
VGAIVTDGRLIRGPHADFWDLAHSPSPGR